MKKLILFIYLFFSLSLVQAQVSNDQWSLVTKKTAEWCPKCGTWGWDMFEQTLEALEGKDVIVWALHYSGDLENQVSQDIVANFGGAGQPNFYLNEDDILVNQNNVNEKVAELEENIDLLNAFNGVAGIEIKTAALSSNETHTIDINTEFFEMASGEFYLGLYVVEDNFLYSQAGQGDNANHRMLLRTSLTENWYGELLRDGPVTSGETFPIAFSNPNGDLFDLSWAEAYLVTIIWNRTNDGKYRFINGNMQKFDIQSNVTELEFDSYKAYFNNQSKEFVLNVGFSDRPENIQINLINQDGRILRNLPLEIKDSKNLDTRFDFNDLNSGYYLLSIETTKGKKVERFVVIE